MSEQQPTQPAIPPTDDAVAPPEAAEAVVAAEVTEAAEAVAEQPEAVTEAAGAEDAEVGAADAENADDAAPAVPEIAEEEIEVTEEAAEIDAAEAEVGPVTEDVAAAQVADDAAPAVPAVTDAEGEVASEPQADALPADEPVTGEPGTEVTAAEGSPVEEPADDLSTTPTPADEAVAVRAALERAEVEATGVEHEVVDAVIDEPVVAEAEADAAADAAASAREGDVIADAVAAEPVPVAAEPDAGKAEPDAAATEPVAVADRADAAATEPLAVADGADAAVTEPEVAVEPVTPIADVTEEITTEETPVQDVAAEETAVETTAAEDTADRGEAAVEEAASSGTPTGPAPRPVPRPSALAAKPAPAAPTPVAPVVPPTGPTAAENAEAARWGRVDDDGSVHVREATGERLVGQYAGGEPADALAFYVQRYWDLNTKVVLFEARLGAADLSGKEIDSTIAALDEELKEPAAVGDLDGLRARVDGLREIAAARRAALEAERAAAKAAALEQRTAIVEAAEKIAATDPERMQWRPAGEKLRELLEEWKTAQRRGPRLDRPTEDALWKRFSHARSAFDRERHRYFAELEKSNAAAKAAKEAIVAEAEKLSGSTDWGATAGAYRDLMTRWKGAGRAARRDDDALWARFRAAQDAFFSARDAANQKVDEEYGANLEVKLRLLEEAEKLVPVTDLAAAKVNLRDIQERWEKAGKVPRADIQRVEGRLRAAEQAVREAEQIQWRRTNPETRARAEGAAAQLHAAIASLEDELVAARKKGDKKAIAEVEAALSARKAWLEQVEKAAEDSRG